MQSTELETRMMGAADEVLNSMFFVGVESGMEEEPGGPGEPDGADGSDADWLAAKVAFRGPDSGQFGVGAPMPTARMLASNFLGQEEAELEDAQVVEVICELSNMICGAYLGGLENASVYDLSHPERDLTFSRSDSGGHCRFLQLDEGQLRVWLRMEPATR